MESINHAAVHHVPWNKGKLVGQKSPLKLREIWAIRIRPLRLPLHNDCPRCNASALADIADSQLHEIARPELAVDREIEERKFTGVLLQLKCR